MFTLINNPSRSRSIAAERLALGLGRSLPLPLMLLSLIGLMSVASAVASLLGH